MENNKSMTALWVVIALIVGFLVGHYVMPATPGGPAAAGTTTLIDTTKSTTTTTVDYASVGKTLNTQLSKTTATDDTSGTTTRLAAAFYGGESTCAAVMGGEMWFLSSVAYSSSDGVTWKNHAGSYPARDRQACVVFNGKVYMMGGQANGVILNDVVSFSGKSWKTETSTAGWAARRDFSAYVYNNKMWIAGGAGASYLDSGFMDAWSSADGKTWTQDMSFVNPTGSGWAKFVVFNNNLLAFKMGSTTLWSSTDGGHTWTTSTIPFQGRMGGGTAIFNGNLYVMGGMTGNLSSLPTDAWYSADGMTWTQAGPSTPWWSGRFRASALTFNGKLWIMGGNNGYNASNPASDIVWSSADGATWTNTYSHTYP